MRSNDTNARSTRLRSTDFSARDVEAASLGARPIPIAPGYYAGFDGSIYSARRIPPDRPIRKLIPGTHAFGYAVYGICINGKSQTKSGHRLVALCFLPPQPSPLHGIRHKDDNPRNNAADNLEWGTQAENIRDRDERGRTGRGQKMARDVPKGELCHFAKLNEIQVSEIKRRLAKGETGVRLSLEFHVRTTTISSIKTGRIWAHVPTPISSF